VNLLTITAEQKDKKIISLLNGTLASVKNIIPLNQKIGKIQILERSFKMEFGVLTGITGDIKGKLMLTGTTSGFGKIGEMMFGMHFEGEMLSSFSGELGNMVAGRLSSNLAESSIKTDITYPTIMQGNMTITGFKKALYLPISFEHAGEMEIYILLD